MHAISINRSSEYWIVELSDNIMRSINEYREMVLWLKSNSDIEDAWSIKSGRELQFSDHGLATMFYLKFC
jgi:hypothetical protein